MSCLCGLMDRYLLMDNILTLVETFIKHKLKSYMMMFYYLKNICNFFFSDLMYSLIPLIPTPLQPNPNYS